MAVCVRFGPTGVLFSGSVKTGVFRPSTETPCRRSLGSPQSPGDDRGLSPGDLLQVMRAKLRSGQHARIQYLPVRGRAHLGLVR